MDVAVAGAPDGPSCEVHYYGTYDEGIAAVEALIRRLVDQDMRPQDIALLSTRRWENSLLTGMSRLAGRQLVDPSNEAALISGSLLYTTMHAFKGLEREAVIAIDMGEIGDPAWSMLHYAGLSRARCLLHVFAPNPTRRPYERQAEAFGRRLQGRVS